MTMRRDIHDQLTVCTNLLMQYFYLQNFLHCRRILKISNKSKIIVIVQKRMST